MGSAREFFVVYHSDNMVVGEFSSMEAATSALNSGSYIECCSTTVVDRVSEKSLRRDSMKEALLYEMSREPQPAPPDSCELPIWNAIPHEEMTPLMETCLRARRDLGLAKYKTLLRVNNGRDPVADCLQEVGDLVFYATQLQMQANGQECGDALRTITDLCYHVITILDEVEDGLCNE